MSDRIQEIRARVESVAPQLIEILDELSQKVAIWPEPCYQMALVCAVEAIKNYEKDVPTLLALLTISQGTNDQRIAEIRGRCDAVNAKPAEEMRIQEIAQMRADNKRLLQYYDKLLQKTQQLEGMESCEDN